MHNPKEQSQDSFARQTKEEYRKALDRQIEEGKRIKADEARRKRDEELVEEARIKKDLERISIREKDLRPPKATQDMFGPNTGHTTTKTSFRKAASTKELPPIQVNCYYSLAAFLN